jgi:hypothetical protein
MLASRMNVVAAASPRPDGDVLTPVAETVCRLKKSRPPLIRAGCRAEIAPRKLALKMRVASPLRIAAVHHAGGAKRCAVHGLAQLRLTRYARPVSTASPVVRRIVVMKSAV